MNAFFLGLTNVSMITITIFHYFHFTLQENSQYRIPDNTHIDISKQLRKPAKLKEKITF